MEKLAFKTLFADKVGRNKKTVCKNPGGRRSKAGGGIAEHRHKNKPEHTTPDKFKKPCKDRKLAESHSLNHKAHNIHQGKRKVKRAVNHKEFLDIAKDFLIA